MRYFLIILMLFISLLIQAGEIDFKPAVLYTVGDAPIDITGAHLNADTNIDLLIVNSGTSQSISILMGNGDGTFNPGIISEYSLSSTPYAIEVGELDGDSHIDIAVARQGGITVFFNNGDGTFTQSATDLNFGGKISGLAISLFKGFDGRDIAVCDYDNDHVYILDNDGFGNFTLLPPIGAGDGPTNIVARYLADYLTIDLAVSNEHSDDFTIFQNDGNLGFTSSTFATTYNQPIDILSWNMVGDSRWDIAVYCDWGGYVEIFENTGSGTFLSRGTYYIFNGSRFLIKDMTRDGKLELLGVDSNLDLATVAINDGTGGFDFPLTFTAKNGDNPEAIFAEDFDKDGRNDIVTANKNSDNISILIQTDPAPDFYGSSVVYFQDVDLFTTDTDSFFYRNIGSADLLLTTMTITGSDADMFSFQSPPDLSAMTEFENNRRLYIDFLPYTSGTKTAQVNIFSNDPDDPLTTIVLRGTGLAPEINLNQLAFDFGQLDVNAGPLFKSLNISNFGTTDLIINGSFTGGEPFIQSSWDGSTISIASSDSYTIDFEFDPVTTGSILSILTINSNSFEEPVIIIPLTGEGIAPALTINPTYLTFGRQLFNAGQTSTQTTTIVNDDLTTLSLVGSFISGGSEFITDWKGTTTTIAPSGSFDVNFSFDPSSVGFKPAIFKINSTDTTATAVIDMIGTGTSTLPAGVYLNELLTNPKDTFPGNPDEYIEVRGPAGLDLAGVFIIILETAGANQGKLNEYTSVVDLSNYAIGSNGFLVVLDDANDPYNVNPQSSIVDFPGFEIDDSMTCFLVHIENGTLDPNLDLDVGNDGLDLLPAGWTIMDGISALRGWSGFNEHGFADIVFSGNANGTFESGAEFINTGFGFGDVQHIMRVGDSTGNTSESWVAFELIGGIRIANSYDKKRYQISGEIVNHVGESNPESILGQIKVTIGPEVIFNHVSVIDLGETVVGSLSISRTVTVENVGSASLQLQSPVIDSPFVVSGLSGFFLYLPPGFSDSFEVRITPNLAGDFTGKLTLSNDGRVIADNNFDFDFNIKVKDFDLSAFKYLNSNALSDSYDDVFPTLDTDRNGNWIVGWSTDDPMNNAGADLDLFYSKSTDNGDSWSSMTFLNIDAASDNRLEFFPHIAMDRDGNAIAVWERFDNLDRDIMVTRSFNAGDSWNTPVFLNSNSNDFSTGNTFPKIITDRKGYWISIWNTTFRPGTYLSNSTDIMISRSSNTDLSWSKVELLNSNNSTTDDIEDELPNLITDGSGNWIAYWYSEHPFTNLGTDTDILYSRSEFNGYGWTDPLPLNSTATDSNARADIDPHIATDEKGTWIAVWSSGEQNDIYDGDLDIFYSRSLNSGETWSDALPISERLADSVGGHGTVPQIDTDGFGNWVVVWQTDKHFLGEGFDDDIMYIISIDNGKTWLNPRFLTLDSDRDDILPKIKSDRRGNWVIVWESRENHLGTGFDRDLFYVTFSLEFTENEGPQLIDSKTKNWLLYN